MDYTTELILRIVHDVFTVIWLGGMIFFLFILLPTLRSTIPKSSERKKVMQQFIDKLAFIVLISMIVLFVTGLVLIPGGHDDPLFLTFVNEYATWLSIKIYICFVMFIISILRLSKIDQITKPAKKHLYVRIALTTNILLGIIVLGMSIHLRVLISTIR